MDIKRLSRADLHIHSNFSDGKMTIRQILDYAEKKTDLAVIAITDHDTIEGAKLAQKIAEKRNLRVKVVIGEEVSTKEGHVLALFIQKKIPAGLSIVETVERIKKQSGIAIAPHPLFCTRFKTGHGITGGIGFSNFMKYRDLFDGIETFNGSPLRNKQNQFIELLNNTIVLKPETGGSDAHMKEAIGIGYTIFEGKNPQNLRTAIENGEIVAGSKKWKFWSLVKFSIRFFPKGLRILFFTLIHGRQEKKPSIFDEVRSYTLSLDSSEDRYEPANF